jgi:hypothetical protein
MSPLKRRILLKLYFLRMFTRSVPIQPFHDGEQFNIYGKGRKEVDLSDMNLDATALDDPGSIILS